MDFGVEGLAAEPVQGLRHGDEVAASVRQATDFGWRREVIDARIGLSLAELFGRQVGGMNMSEMLGQCPRGLAVAGAAVPGQILRRALPRQPGEKFGRIGRSGLGVIRSVAGKMVRGQSLRPFR